MHLHPYVVDELAEEHHRQLIALARAERVARRRARRTHRVLLRNPPCDTGR